MSEFFRRLRWFFHRKQFERELDEEMSHHLAMSGGKQFGNVTLIKENSRSMWTFTFWEQFAQDIRYGVRTMTASKLFTAMAVLSLALGIGANTAIYSFMDAVLLRTLPVRNPKELVILKWRSTGRSAVIHGLYGTNYGNGKHGFTSPNFPFAAFEMLQAGNSVASTLFAYVSEYRLNIVADGSAEVVQGQYVSGGFYAGLGVTPAAGRLISADDDRAGAPLVAVISYGYWQRRFNLDPAAIGKQILVNNVPFTVVGVSAPGFFGVDSGIDPRVFMALHAVPLRVTNAAADEKRRFFDRNFYWVEMMARLRPGVTAAQAEAQFAGRFRHFVESTAATAKDWKDMPALWLDDGAGGLDSLRHQYSKPLLVLMTMVGLILTIACANIANLLLARATARRREMAVRLSLGAGRMRVVRQLLTESVLLSLTGGALGLLVAFWGIRSITWLLANSNSENGLRASLNWPVLGFTLGLAVLTGIVFGLVPALQATKLDITPALKETRASAARVRTRRFGLRVGLSHALVVSQIAISLLLVVAAGLFVRTLANLRSVELGFNQENLLLFSLDAKQAGYKDAALAGFYGNLLDRFHAIPGVTNTALSNNALVSHYWNDESLVLPVASQTEKHPSTCVMYVNADFLQTMEIPIMLGRGMEARDMQAPRMAVVSEQFTKQFFPNQNPIGQRFGLGDEKSPADIEIVGVAKNSRYNDLRNDNPAVIYVPYTQNLKSLGRAEFELRTAGNPLALANTVRQIVHQASTAVPVAQITTQAATIDENISQERTFADLCTCFALLALLIACVGLYGSMAYAVARRTSEIGIRMALGAERRGIVWMVIREVLALAAVGLAIGLGIAWETAHFVASFLFGMKANDPMAIALSVAVLTAAAIAAGYAPAWRASRIDPMVALRHE